MSVQIADLPSLAGDRTPIPVNYVRNLVELVHEFGLDTDRLLAHVGLTQAEVYSAEPALRFEQFQRVMAGARDLSGDPAIGLALCRQLTVTAHGLLGYAAISSADRHVPRSTASRWPSAAAACTARRQSSSDTASLRSAANNSHVSGNLRGGRRRRASAVCSGTENSRESGRHASRHTASRLVCRTTT